MAAIIYLWKVIVWDKVLAWGTTDAITGDVAANPTVTFIDHGGNQLTMQDGNWLR